MIETKKELHKKYLEDLKDGDIKQLFRDRASYKHYNKRAYNDTLSYDEENKRYVLDRKTVKMKKIEPSDLAVTGEKYHYFNTELKPPVRMERDAEGYVNTSAISNYQYMVNNDINDSMASRWKGKPIDVKVLLIAGAVVIVFGVWYMFFR